MSAVTLLCGDAVEEMRTLPADSVHCVVTSPPYFGLRSYLPAGHPDKVMEIGGEYTPDEYVARMVAVFAEVRRVLHPSGVLFLNLGDSYARQAGDDSTKETDSGMHTGRTGRSEQLFKSGNNRPPPGLKPKDLIGIPWMTAFALRADGWYLRSEIIWHKKAPMPESVLDRPTKAHEQVFLLAKSERYFYDAEAIREPFAMSSWTADKDAEGQTRRGAEGIRSGAKGNARANGAADGTRYGATSFQNGGYTQAGRNRRSVWTLGPESFDGAHYAVMPTKLVEPCILSGSSAHGVCAKCLAPYERVVEREHTTYDGRRATTPHNPNGAAHSNYSDMQRNVAVIAHTLGWQPTCTCGADVTPAVVLDPFAGSGTVLAVALKFGRSAIGIDLDARNLPLARQRIEQSQPLLFSL